MIKIIFTLLFYTSMMSYGKTIYVTQPLANSSFYHHSLLLNKTVASMKSAMIAAESFINGTVHMDYNPDGLHENVVIELAVGQLMDISAPLPSISGNSVSKSLTIKRSQSFINSGSAQGFNINSNYFLNPGILMEITGISEFKLIGVEIINPNAIGTASLLNVTAVSTSSVGKVEISGCKFQDINRGVSINYSNVEVKVINNFFSRIGEIVGVSDDFGLEIHCGGTSIDNVEIINNSFNEVDLAISTHNATNSWKINLNTIDQCATGFRIWLNIYDLPSCSPADPCNTCDEFRIDFIKEPNSLGLTEKNHDNIITNTIRAFEFYNDINSRVIGYDFSGKIFVVASPTLSTNIHNLIVRECLPQNDLNNTFTSPHNFPITLNNTSFSWIGLGESSTDFYEAPINILSASLSAQQNGTVDLIINYDIATITSGMGDNIIVEFYETEQNQTFLEFIGSDELTNPTNGSYTKVFSNVQMSNANTSSLAGLVTSLGSDISNCDVDEVGILGVDYISLPLVFCNACGNLEPIAEGRYWLSGWVHVGSPTIKNYASLVKTFANNSNPDDAPHIQLEIENVNSAVEVVNLRPSGEIIDGWQRIVGDFNIPQQTQELGLYLVADKSLPTYFDDIRLHPFNASMKSYVYDGETFWLTSELDDNNYATFYEYDSEGGLIRIKKETARGIVTIQETRSNSPKTD